MKIRSYIVVVTLAFLLTGAGSGSASEAATTLEKSMSDTLDVWRDGRYEQLFDLLAHRGKTSREMFVKNMRVSTTRPACCWQKMGNFRILNEKRTEATVYVKIGLDSASGETESTTREFKMTHQEGVWKMQLADVIAIAGVTGKKKSNAKRHSSNSPVYHY